MKSSSLINSMLFVITASAGVAVAQTGLVVTKFEASASTMREGAVPKLSWNVIKPPVVVTDLIEIAPNGVITTKVDQSFSINTVAASYFVSKHRVVRAEYQVGATGSWSEYFRGIKDNKATTTNSTETPSTASPFLVNTVLANSQVLIKARFEEPDYVTGWSPANQWSPFVTQGSPVSIGSVLQRHALVFKNGDLVPEEDGVGGSTSIRDTLDLQVYMEVTNIPSTKFSGTFRKKFKLTNREAVICFELGARRTSNKSAPSPTVNNLDQNDYVAAVTFLGNAPVNWKNRVVRTDIKTGQQKLINDVPATGENVAMDPIGEEGVKYDLWAYTTGAE
jgi:hypothetical protein